MSSSTSNPRLVGDTLYEVPSAAADTASPNRLTTSLPRSRLWSFLRLSRCAYCVNESVEGPYVYGGDDGGGRC